MNAKAYRDFIMKLSDEELILFMKHSPFVKAKAENDKPDTVLSSVIKMTSTASEKYKVIKSKIERGERIEVEDMGWFDKIDFFKKVTDKKLPEEIARKGEKEVFKYIYKSLLDNNISNSMALMLSPYLTNYVVSGEAKKALLLVGNPGCGKTELAKIIAKILERPLYSTCPSQSDRNHGIRGEGSSYKMPDMGEIFRADYETGCDNPVILFDEVSTGIKADHQVNFEDEFLTILDNETMSVTDNFLSLKKSLKHSLLIFTDNELDSISVRFQERCVVLKVPDVELERMTNIIGKYIASEAKKLKVSVEYSESDLNEYINKLYNRSFHSIRRMMDMVDFALNSAWTRHILSDAKGITVSPDDFEKAAAVIIAGGGKETRKIGI